MSSFSKYVSVGFTSVRTDIERNLATGPASGKQAIARLSDDRYKIIACSAAARESTTTHL